MTTKLTADEFLNLKLTLSSNELNTATSDRVYLDTSKAMLGKAISGYDMWQSLIHHAECNTFIKKPEPRRIVKNGPATIVFWWDGTKTVVKRKKGDKDDIYSAFCAALAIKLYESNSHVKKMIEVMTVDETKKSEKKSVKKSDQNVEKKGQ